MTPQEINLAIAKLVYSLTRYTIITDKHNVILVFKGKVIQNLDYCNNWNDLMPLVVEYNLTLEVFEDGSARVGRYFEHKNPVHVLQHKSPQIALATCLLKVLQSKEGDK